MSDKVPALTEEQWKAVGEALEVFRDAAEWAIEYADAPQSAIDAAARLNRVIESIEDGQPFGFMWEDVEALRKQADALERSYALVAAFVPPNEHRSATPEVSAIADRFRSVADRLESLLPPREP